MCVPGVHDCFCLFGCGKIEWFLALHSVEIRLVVQVDLDGGIVVLHRFSRNTVQLIVFGHGRELYALGEVEPSEAQVELVIGQRFENGFYVSVVDQRTSDSALVIHVLSFPKINLQSQMISVVLFVDEFARCGTLGHHVFLYPSVLHQSMGHRQNYELPVGTRTAY